MKLTPLAIACAGLTVVTAQPLGVAQTSPLPDAPEITISPMPEELTPSLSEVQQREIQTLIEDELQTNGEINELIETEIQETFDWTLNLLNMLITVLIAIPIVTGMIALALRNAIIDQLVQQIRKQMQEQIGREVEEQLRLRVALELEKQVEDLKHQLKTQVELSKQELELLKADFNSRLTRSLVDIEQQKDQAMSKLARLTAVFVQYDDGTALEVETSTHSDELNQIQELTEEIGLLKSSNPQLQFTAEDYLNEGDAFYIQKQYRAALDAYESAIGMQPNLIQAWLSKAKVLSRMKRYPEAIAANERAIEINPNCCEGWFGIGRVKGNLKQYQEAIESHQQALHIDPNFYPSLKQMVYLHTKLGQFEQAAQPLEKMLAIAPKASGAHYVKAYYHTAKREFEQAFAELEQAILLYPNFHQIVQTDPDFAPLRSLEPFTQLAIASSTGTSPS